GLLSLAPQGGTMPERPADPDLAAGLRPETPPLPSSPPLVHRVFCVKCAAEVTALPPAARFCSRCGSPLPEHFYRHPSRQAPAPEAPAGALTDVFPPREILLAYAKALLNLGWR